MMTQETEQSDEEVLALDIVVLLDRSGSMKEIRDDVIGSFNAFLADKQEKYPDSRMSVVLFDDRYDQIADSVPITRVMPLTSQTYVPRGSTALLDAIGLTIAAIEAREYVQEEMLVAICTDGRESASGLFRLERIQDGWDFVYLSSDPDGFVDAGQMWFDIAKTKRFDKMVVEEAYDEINLLMGAKEAMLRMKRGGAGGKIHDIGH